MTYIKNISKKSPFYGKLKIGDGLISVNGEKINDILDYMYHTAGDEISIAVERDGKQLEFRAKHGMTSLGIDFDSFLMDKHRACKNKCIFCFIDQLPKNMRDTVYYKDDDFRLSILQGNYVTLTNMSDSDIERIIRLKISPLNISVHATDGDVRAKMMRNPNAKNIMELLRRFYDNELTMRCQIVLCKGINDGKILEKSLDDLESLYPYVSSVSIVPVGLSKCREGLYPLEPLSAQDSREALSCINSHGDRCVEKYGTRLFYPADEFFINADSDVPETAYYEDFEQYENGVGILSLFKEDFMNAVGELAYSEKKLEISVASGRIMEKSLPLLFDKLKEKLPNVKVQLNFIRNDFFGERVTVTGLVTGGDIIAQLKGKPLGQTLYIPGNMLRDGVFLDDTTVADVSEALAVEVREIPYSICDFINGLSE